MKTCSKCSEAKSLDSFSKNGKNTDGRHAWCKLCFAEYERNRYKNGDRKRKEQNRANTVARRRQFLWDLLSKSACLVCGETDPLVLEFDHRDPAEKSYEISDMFYLSQIKIQEEIDKCNILCCNCHRRRTIEQFGWWRGNQKS